MGKSCLPPPRSGPAPTAPSSVWSPPCAAVVMVCLLRYAQVIEHSRRCWVNTSALVSGCTNAVGLVMVGNFQVRVAPLHLAQIALTRVIK